MTTPVERERSPCLWEWWDLLCRSFDADPDAMARWRDELRRRHEEPHRRYHTDRHLVSVFNALEELEEQGPATMYATFFHDAIYDPRATDNELRSAELAALALAEMDATVDHDLVRHCIEATAGHQLPPIGGSDEVIVATFLDADLSILGAPEAVYDQYAEAIRAEYAHVPDDVYSQGRAEVLTNFERRDQIFFTDRAAQRWEHQARANLSREFNELANYC